MMRAWMVAAGLVLGGAAGAQEVAPPILYEEGNWILRFHPAASEEDRPACGLTMHLPDRPMQSFGLHLSAPGEARLRVENWDWVAEPPPLPLGARIGRRTWELGWTLAGEAAEARLRGEAEIAEVWDALAFSEVLRLTGEDGAVLLWIELDGSGPAFGALRDCVETRLGTAPG